MNSTVTQKRRNDAMNRNSPNQNRPYTNESELIRIWEISKTAEPHSTAREIVSEAETENALRSVWDRIDSSGMKEETKVHDASRNRAERFWIWGRYMVAAAALIIAVSWYLFVPVTVTAPYGEQVTLDLPDGSQAELNSGTSITYNRALFGRTDRDLTLNGEAWFDVTPSGIPFTVKANGTLTSVLGTSFNIRSWSSDPENDTELSVSSGRVAFMPQQDIRRGVTLEPGQLSRWDPSLTEPTTPVSVPISEITGWRENRIIFREQSLRVIINELERRFDTTIDLDVPGAEDDPITAYYNSPQNLQTVLDDISMVKGLRYAETANGYRIFK
ncbi:FecR family protein [Rhodohalobacter mucosus]|uniref:FecR family protein n=1 Tax=Rhodohalobacter mucosus TaxID=2079485 RepID=A0A316TNS8_9BACT|nr:FecR domain-containing protein [Rhodohalobacter mucosus]PWN05311.1 hypothetical protein DDZ15_14660 [Rhodohalobacter mucosus]